MKRHYIGGVEVTEAEVLALVGDDSTREYIRSVYRGEMAIEAVPQELREAVQGAVEARIARHGEYLEQEITAAELQSMIEEVV